METQNLKLIEAELKTRYNEIEYNKDELINEKHYNTIIHSDIIATLASARHDIVSAYDKIGYAIKMYNKYLKG